MAYSDSEIRDLAMQLQSKGAAPGEIESFVRSAKIDQHGATPAAPAAPQSFGGSGLMDSAAMVVAPGVPNPVPMMKAMYGAGPEAGGATAGQILGTPLAEFGGIQAGGAIGGFLGNGVTQLRHMADGSQNGYKLGAGLAAGLTGSVPGASLAKAGAGGVIKAGIKYGAANLAGKTLQTGIDEQRMPTSGEAAIAFGSGMVAAPAQKYLEKAFSSGVGIVPGSPEANAALMSVRDQTLKDARSAGYVIPGSRVNPSMANKTLESIAGKAATAQDMVVKNQAITNELARKAIGLPAGEAITETAIQNVRDEAGKAYQAVADLSPEAADTLKKLGQARADASLLWKKAAMSPDPATRDAASAMSAQAESYENTLEGFAQDAPANGAKLVENMRKARVTIAKSYQVENALNKANGDIEAPIIGASFDKSNKLTDELAVIGRFQQAFPAYARPAASTPTGGVSKLKAVASGILGTQGYHVAGIPGAVVGAAAPLSSDAVRAFIKSKPYQRSFMAAPDYGLTRADAGALFARFLTQNAGRTDTSQLDAEPLLYNNGQ